jgi:hypothetical protein
VVQSIYKVRLEFSLHATINTRQSLKSLSLWAFSNNMINYRLDYLGIWGFGMLVKLLFHYAEGSNFYRLWSIKAVKRIPVIRSWKIAGSGYLELGNSEIIIMEVGWAWILVSFVKCMETICRVRKMSAPQSTSFWCSLIEVYCGLWYYLILRSLLKIHSQTHNISSMQERVTGALHLSCLWVNFMILAEDT